MRVYKETIARRQKDAEFRLEKHQKDLRDFTMRRFKRRAILFMHQLEQKLLREVRVYLSVFVNVSYFQLYRLLILERLIAMTTYI